MRVSKLIPAIIVVLLFISISCRKDNNSNGPRLRITKIADNPAMENPEIFEYNSNGLLVKIDYGNNQEFMSIEYNEINQPIKLLVGISDGTGDIHYTNIDTIIWNPKGYTLTYQTIENSRYEYNLSSNGQLSSRTIFERKNTLSVFDTAELWKSDWIGRDKLKIVHSYYPPYEENDEWEEDLSFGTGYSPLKGINIALVEFASGWLPWQPEYQNLYPTTKYSHENLTIDIVYELNKDDFPIKAEIKYSNSDTHDFIYFEYESY
jgi:hypothetical protein